MKTKFVLVAASLVVLNGSSVFATDSSDVKAKTSEAVSAVGDYASESKEEFNKSIEKDLGTIKGEIDDLKKKASATTGAAHDSLKRQIAELDAKRAVLSKRLDATSKTTGQAWSDMKSGISKAMDELKAGYQKAKETVSEKTDSVKNK